MSTKCACCKGAQQLYQVGCSNHHTCCTGCLQGVIEIAQTSFPICPAPRCEYELTLVEIEKICGGRTPEYNRISRLSRRSTSFSNYAPTINNHISSYAAVPTAPPMPAPRFKPFPDIVMQKQCTLCFSDFAVDDMYTLDCPSSHRYCYPCLRGYIKANLNHEPGAAVNHAELRLPTCPAHDPLCGYKLTPNEIKQILDQDDELTRQQKQKFVDTANDVAFNDYVGSQNDRIKRCPQPNCRGMVEVPPGDPNEKWCCRCPSCQFTFCSLCRDQYHYRTACQRIMSLRIVWEEWKTLKRQEHELGKTKNQNDIRKFEAEREQRQQRINELIASEQALEQIARNCPHCNAVVIHVSGCDSMVCGRDYHGTGPIMKGGCGRAFAWSAAKPYVRKIDDAPLLKELNKPAPQQEQAVRHENIKCDNCKQEIVGIRFACVHCPWVDVCEKCEPTLVHDPSHVFCILRTV